MTAPRPTGSGDRVILHVDMDAFFASVEVLDDPSLAGKPVIVGGSGDRGVVAACTYEARRFGVHSAMPSSVARRRCPDAVFVAGRFHRYNEESQRLHDVLSTFTPLVEGIALDEAFLDVTGATQLFGDGATMAAAIRQQVLDELRLPCSVGVGRSKLISKLASKAAKPVATREAILAGPGVVEIAAQDEHDFLAPLPIRALWGIGPVTGKKLEALGVTTVGALATFDGAVLERYLGRAVGRQLSELSRGIDSRPVVPVQQSKSIGHEETFSADLWSDDELRIRLQRMSEASAAALRSNGRMARTVTIKLRFSDFRQVTRSHTLEQGVDTAAAITAVAMALFEGVERRQGVRLLGVSLTGLVGEPGSRQLQWEFPDARSVEAGDGSGPAIDDQAAELQETWGAVTSAIDAIRSRYGRASVGTAAQVVDGGISVRRRGDAQWGPESSAGSGRPESSPGAGGPEAAGGVLRPGRPSSPRE